jgi:hypothetical protein
MHGYRLGDRVYHPCDAAPFIVVGIRAKEVEIKGDWSGGTHNIDASSWVGFKEIKPYDNSKVVYYINSKPYKNGVALNK